MRNNMRHPTKFIKFEGKKLYYYKRLTASFIISRTCTVLRITHTFIWSVFLSQPPSSFLTTYIIYCTSPFSCFFHELASFSERYHYPCSRIFAMFLQSLVQCVAPFPSLPVSNCLKLRLYDDDTETNWLKIVGAVTQAFGSWGVGEV